MAKLKWNYIGMSLVAVHSSTHALPWLIFILWWGTEVCSFVYFIIIWNESCSYVGPILPSVLHLLLGCKIAFHLSLGRGPGPRSWFEASWHEASSRKLLHIDLQCISWVWEKVRHYRESVITVVAWMSVVLFGYALHLKIKWLLKVGISWE